MSATDGVKPDDLDKLKTENIAAFDHLEKLIREARQRLSHSPAPASQLDKIDGTLAPKPEEE